LHWRPRWSLPTALAHIVQWHRAWREQQDMRALGLAQIQHYQQTHS
jgi:CDP-glucose 4,6-dehydratase